MKKYLIVLISFIVLFSACSGNKVPSEEKSSQVEKKDIMEDKTKTNYDIEKNCKTFPVTEKDSQKAEKKLSWGNAADFTLTKIDG